MSLEIAYSELSNQYKDLLERYECKVDGLNAALLTIDALEKARDKAIKDHTRCCETNNENANKRMWAEQECSSLREALERIADYHGDEPWRNNSGIAREALSRQALSGKGERE